MQHNLALVDYGIQNEKSDLRLHVCFQVKRVYVYQTRYGVEVVKQGRYKQVPVFTDGRLTARGYLVPPMDIKSCVECEPQSYLWEIVSLNPKMSTSEKGRAAVSIAAEALRRGLIPIPVLIDEVTDYNTQVGGTDIIVHGGSKIQVKCDLRGGRRELGGTGNLFLQVAERNILKAF